MGPNVERPLEPETAEVKRPNRYQTGVRTLIALVACCGLIFWAWRNVWEHRDPALTEARAIQAGALRALQSRKATERVAAIQELDRLQLQLADSAIAIRPLTAMLADEDSEVRLESAQALGKIGAVAVRSGSDGDGVRAAVAALIKLLKESQPGLRVAAANSLGSISSAKPGGGSGPIEAVTAALTEALGDREAKVRGAAVVALDAASSHAADPPKALAAMLTDESAENRRLAVARVWQFRRGLDSWVPTVLRMAEHDEDPAVRQACVGTLQWIKPPAVTAASVPVLIGGLGSRNWQVRNTVADLLVRFGADVDAAIPALLRVLTEPIDEKEPGANGEPDWGVAGALGRIAPGSAAAEEVITALTEVVRSGPRIRQGSAAWTLSQFGSAAATAIPVLIRMVREAGPAQAGDNEAVAARALGLIAPDTPAADEVVTVLVAVLQSDRARSREAAIQALQRFGPKAAIAIPKIRALREDKDLDVKRAAASALVLLEEGTTP